MTVKPLRLFVPITKIDVEKRLVYGTIANEDIDRVGESFDYASSKPHFEEWSNGMAKASGGKNLGNVRVMHTAKAAGMLTDIAFDDDAKKIDGVAHVVDDEEWNKVEKGVYTGFSIGGSYARKWADKKTGVKKYTARPAEVSLVDAPCIKSATFEVVKGAEAVELRKFVTREPNSAEIAVEATALAKAAGEGKVWTDFIAEGRASLVEKMLGADEKLDLTGHADMIEGEPTAEELAKAMERTTTTEKTSTTERMSDDPKNTDKEGGEASGKGESDKQMKEEEDKTGDNTQNSDKENREDKEGGETKVPGLASEDDEPADASKMEAARGLVKQVWLATDGTTHDKKDDCVKHQLTVDVAAHPLTKAIASARNVLQGSPGEDPLAKFWSEQPEGLRDPAKIAKALVGVQELTKDSKGFELRKGMWDVSRLGDALMSLASIQACLANEQVYEKDDSKNPVKLRDAIMTLAECFMDIAKEELSEMLATMPGGIVQVKPESDPEVGVAIAEAMKSVSATTLEKIGARNSKADIGRLQKIHDYLVELGVACAPETAEKLAKAEIENETLQKVVSDAIPAIEELKKGMAAQAEEIKKIKSLPMPGGPGRLNVVEKGGASPETDRTVADPAVVEELVKNYTPEQLQHMMIKAAQARPQKMLTRGNG